MRLNLEGDLTAGEIVNTYTEKEIADLIYKYGEERYSRRIASAICRSREEEEIVLPLPRRYHSKGGTSVPLCFHRNPHFQALRIAVNGRWRIVPP